MSYGLVIGVPTLGRPVSLDWAFAFKSINPPINYNTIFSVIRGKPVDEARNLIVEEALKQDAKYIWFIGDDTINPPHTLRQFIFRMENVKDCGVVGGVYCVKTEPSAPLVFKDNGVGSYWDWKIGEFFEVTGLGMDCTLIRTDIFRKMAAPWFKTVDKDGFMDGTNYAEMWTEDLYFLHRVRNETEFKVYCDASVLADHVDVTTGKVYKLPPYSLPMRRFAFQAGENKKKIVDIGCGKTWREFEEGVPIRVDIDESCNPDYRCDVRNLPFDAATFDIVFSSHVLEHFAKSQQKSVLEEWIRILKPEGELRLILPNIMWAARALADESFRKELLGTMPEYALSNHVSNVLYGAQTTPHDFHYNGFTPGSLEMLLKDVGFKIMKYEEQGYNMILTARREQHLVEAPKES